MAKMLMWRPYILSSPRTFIQTQKRPIVSHNTIFSKKSETNLLLWTCTRYTKIEHQIESNGYNSKLSKLGFGVVGNRRFYVRATNVNDAGSIDSPIMQSMEKKIKESLNADSVGVKDAYGDGRHVRQQIRVSDVLSQ